MSFKINLNNVKTIKDFVNFTQKLSQPSFISGERYTVDAKSLMGILSLNLSQPLTLSVDMGSDKSGTYYVYNHNYIVTNLKNIGAFIEELDE